MSHHDSLTLTCAVPGIGTVTTYTTINIRVTTSSQAEIVHLRSRMTCQSPSTVRANSYNASAEDDSTITHFRKTKEVAHQLQHMQYTHLRSFPWLASAARWQLGIALLTRFRIVQEAQDHTLSETSSELA